jgi:hypothetical protein
MRDAYVTTPQGAQIVHVERQGEQVCLWAIVDTLAERVEREFQVFGTGHELPSPEKATYVATWQEGPFVWHLFEML